MTYLLDTNACIAIINGTPTSVRNRFAKALEEAETRVLVPAVAAFELWFGVAKSARAEANTKRVELFFAGRVQLLPFDGEDARSAGYIRAATEAAGKPIGAYDLLIAGQAVRHGLTLVTSNAREICSHQRPEVGGLGEGIELTPVNDTVAPAP